MQAMSLTSNELFASMTWIPETISRKYSKYQNYTDLLQLGYLSLWRAVLSFDWSKSRNPTAYIYPWVKKEIGKAALEEKNYLERYLLVDDSLTYSSELVFDLEKLLTQAEDRLVIKNILNKLNRDNGEVIRLVFGIGSEECSLRKAGDIIGVSHEKVRKMKEKTLKTIKAYYCCWN